MQSKPLKKRLVAAARRSLVMLLAVVAVIAVHDRGVPVAMAAEPVPASGYALSIAHRQLSTVQLDSGAIGLELELTVANAGEHGLYDLRIYLDRTMTGPALAHAPATVRMLPAGETTTVTWTFEALPAPPIPGLDSQIALRLEAVDTTTQQLVTFNVDSAEQ